MIPDEQDCLLDMARGLEHIHSKHFVHRDLKPENILISLPDNNNKIHLKISDFGLCKSTSERGTFSMSDVKGTVNYLAPEVLQLLEETSFENIRGTLNSDIFSLGCTFHYFLTKGIHPF
jgi:serine/threonine protein kinase